MTGCDAWIAHQSLTKGRYLDRLAQGCLFWSMAGEHLPDADAVREALKRDGEVWSDA